MKTASNPERFMSDISAMLAAERAEREAQQPAKAKRFNLWKLLFAKPRA